MKNSILLLILLAIPFLSFSQNKKYKIEGTTMYMSHHQGGAENRFEPQPFPKGNVTLYVVELVSDKKSKQIAKITSESDGRFKIKLPPGVYGFVVKEDLDSLAVGQFLPKGYSTGDIMESKSSTWSISNNIPVVIIDKDITGVIITNFEQTVCGICP